ncbi:hypothetical protein KY284_021376 [Solanum tuberosum]|nr:hypothetical protein KY284_021376 [Solanum tuberosum]
MAERIDHTHPLYVHPSDTPGTVPIPFQLKGSENYGIWRRSMTIALQAKRKLGFVTCVCTKDLVRDEHHEHWETCNALERFDKVNRMRIYQLHREINTIVQGTNSIVEYFTKLKELWSEFDAMVPSTDCGCAKGKENVKHLQQQRLLHFLGGLNDSYDQARRQILMKTVEPILNQAYALIIEDECQKGTGLKAMPNLIVKGNDITALWSARGSQTYMKPHNEHWNERCDFCKIKGHIKANCYKFTGYPPNYKGKKKDGIAANNSFLGDQYPMRSLDQFSYNGNNFHPQPTGSHYNGYSSNNYDFNGYTPEVPHRGIVTSFHASSMPNRWIVDTGVTNHMTSDLRLLYETCKQQGQHVHLPDGSKTFISHIGQCRLPQGVIQNVLHVPDFEYNLLSVSKLIRELQCCMTFYPDYCLLQDLHTGKVKGIGRLEGGLYYGITRNKTIMQLL